MKTIEKNNVFEEEIKSSKFITHIFKISSIEEANEILAKIRKKYYDATHNCYAYKIGEYEKASDDGEPQKTAGYPILNAINSYGITNVLVVVTRYFGGVLLGTGGLSRAYGGGAKSVIQKCKIISYEEGYLVKTIINYENVDKLNNFLENNGIEVKETKYLEEVIYYIFLRRSMKKKYIEFLEKITNSKIAVCYYRMDKKDKLKEEEIKIKKLKKDKEKEEEKEKENTLSNSNRLYEELEEIMVRKYN